MPQQSQILPCGSPIWCNPSPMPKLTDMQKDARSRWLVSIIVLVACARAATIVNAQDASRNDDRSYFPPPDTQGGWRKAADVPGGPAALGIDTRKLDEAFEIAQQSTKNGGLAVVRRGWLV